MKVERGGWGAFALSLFFPGAGQVFAGRVPLGVLFFALLAFVPLSSTLLCLVFPAWTGFILPQTVVWLVCRLAFAWHALLVRAGPRRPTKVVVTAFAVVSTALAYGVSFTVRVLFIEPYKLPTQSMVPGLLAGDQFFVLKRGPHAGIGRGTVVVYHQAPRDLVKRVIGLPGERVEIRDGRVSIDGKPLGRHPCQQAEVDWSEGGRAHRSPCAVESTEALGWEITADAYPEGDGEWTVPPDSYFVLGDNRMNSKDSRFDGPVPVPDVRGRVEGVWVSFGDAMPWLRPERIGARPYLAAPRE